jgi:hypothetical protein
MLTRTFAFLILSAIAISAEAPPFASADSSASPRIAALRKQVELGNTTAVAQFWREIARNHAPLVEANPADDRSSLVTFVWQAKAETRNVVVIGGVAGIDIAANQMIRLGTTDLWYKTYTVRNDARFGYQFSPNDSLEPLDRLDPKDMAAMMKRLSTLEPDPLNPRKFQQGPIPLSYVELSAAAPQPWIAPVDDPKGAIEQKKLRSNILNNERTVWVYTPPGFTASGERYPFLVVFDGEAYVNSVPVPIILDNLIAKKLIPPMVAIMIGNASGTSRATELPCSAPFADFLAKEAVPWMRDNYHATSDAARTFVAGSSYGGLASVYAAQRRMRCPHDPTRTVCA